MVPDYRPVGLDRGVRGMSDVLQVLIGSAIVACCAALVILRPRPAVGTRYVLALCVLIPAGAALALLEMIGGKG